MREVIIARINTIVGPFELNRETSRWKPAQNYIQKNVLGLDPDSKTARRDIRNVNFVDTETLALMSDEMLMEYFELILRRYSIQM